MFLKGRAIQFPIENENQLLQVAILYLVALSQCLQNNELSTLLNNCVLKIIIKNYFLSMLLIL